MFIVIAARHDSKASVGSLQVDRIRTGSNLFRDRSDGGLAAGGLGVAHGAQRYTHAIRPEPSCQAELREPPSNFAGALRRQEHGERGGARRRGSAQPCPPCARPAGADQRAAATAAETKSRHRGRRTRSVPIRDPRGIGRGPRCFAVEWSSGCGPTRRRRIFCR
jgi:hypothetical protein